MQTTQEVEVQNSESSISSTEIGERDTLLDAYDEELQTPKNLSFKALVFAFVLLLLLLGLILPKIYISNQIYYISKDINAKYHTYKALKEENTHLKRQYELEKYQTEVLDELTPSWK